MKPARDTAALPWPGVDPSPEPRFSLLIVGDVRIEVRAQLPDRRFTDLTADHLGYTAVDGLVAGTAVNLARRSAGVFRSVTVAGKIGDDAFTPVIRRTLHDLGVRDLLTADPGTPNGFTLMLRDRPDPGGHGVRLLVAGDAAPSARLSARDVHRFAPAIEDADALFLDGYALLSPASRAALLAAARIAHPAGTLVAFDLVPHDIHARLAPADALPVLDSADVVISAATTLAHLAGRPPARDSAGVRRLLRALDGMSGRDPLWLLRFGATGMEHVLAYRRGTLLIEYPTGYGTNGERAGYGDRLAVSELYWWLSRRPGR